MSFNSLSSIHLSVPIETKTGPFSSVLIGSLTGCLQLGLTLFSSKQLLFTVRMLAQCRIQRCMDLYLFESILGDTMQCNDLQ